MLHIIGLGLNEKGYSKEAYDAIKEADEIYVDTYTIEFPYKISEFIKQFKRKKFVPAGREFVEGMSFIEKAKKKDIVLLVYGSPLVATTHNVIIKEANEKKVKIKIIHAGSILDAVAETGLQPYKFGKTTSLPNFPADSYLDVVKNNKGIDAHSLILVDIGLQFKDALERLEKDSKNKKLKLNKIVVCERLGSRDSKIYYGSISKLKKKKVKTPFCLIVPGKLHFLEEEFLKSFEI